jgi:hypothetical protein
MFIAFQLPLKIPEIQVNFWQIKLNFVPDFNSGTSGIKTHCNFCIQKATIPDFLQIWKIKQN